MPPAVPLVGLAARLNELHQAQLRGDPTASADIFSEAYPRLCRAIHAIAPAANEDHVSDACTNAIVEYLANPAKFDARKSSLWTFLNVIARRRLTDARRSARREHLDETTRAEFELLSSPTNNNSGEDYVLSHEIARTHLREIAQDEKELRVLELMCSGIRDTEQYAVALGLDSSDPATAREVKRVKDKLKARLRKVRYDIDGSA
jgi:DNA-directed RNA polymerase specialized sigma24 family protein